MENIFQHKKIDIIIFAINVIKHWKRTAAINVVPWQWQIGAMSLNDFSNVIIFSKKSYVSLCHVTK